MTVFRRVASLKPGLPNDNRIIFEWQHPSGPLVGQWASYFINQQTLSGYSTAEELKAALDFWTNANFGYVFDDVWFHLNDDGTWAIATGQEPTVWPEDETHIP